ncbi:acetate--CoA ligase family protein [Bordetella pseudohinzii]|uniref:6-carboxyhexanoate--CoA ligase n=1 Tax=Bordetella pseudohinzii TaxID=1331258 RepID=A0A0J6BSK6_9BORD|nr:acetate--CoA ligase family protein [Bordetella pseudohinzii]ANY17729.1 6-carboxyhexanoate--CoA ligase [Bordetella pseudohinzii]KMM24809.1 6-carboxyhexanoate--CoA ligase [Bordetella pseudohinzii]KXA77931.1 6-carboxyhexanoate--CoA ligase [Bordetella pseudohinzii]KXA79670.1 6-carboxyhexanoate--CoA ligase [Bordetella pseudohinzii]CUJ02315.1 Succinyl-CoA ligase [ADP-forming] subunit alpha [Bordetella pseudohinzii]
MAVQTQRPGAGLQAFFEARGIAIIGASDDITKIGGRPVHMLVKYGYAGPVYPINPKGGTIQGLPAYASVRDTPTAPELAILAVPAAATPAALRDCAARGVKAAIVLSSGFVEAGPQGAALQDELVAIARENAMRVLGPNCLGAVNVADRLIGSFSIALEEHMPPAGQVGIVSQSGNVGSHTMQSVARRGMGVSRFIATGNEADVDVADGIAALAEDPATRIILCCMETCRHAGKLIEALRMAREQGKPVIVLKIGSTEKGQAAAASHTGALTGSDAVIDAIFRRHGVLRVRSVEALIDIGHAASLLMPGRLPRNDAVTLVAASGGFGIMMADAMSEAGLALPSLAPHTQARIREAVPTASTGNPVDASAQMSSRPDILLKMLTALLDDPSESALALFMSLSLYNTRLRGIYLEALAQVRASHPDRLLMIISQGPAEAIEKINALGIPVFSSIDAAATGLAGLMRLGQLRAADAAPSREMAAEPVDPAVFRNEFHAKQALAQAGIDVPREIIARDADEAARAAEAIGYPVVLKIASEDIAHKTEAGGVALNLADAQSVREAYARVQANAARHSPRARIDGVLVAPMVRGGTEMIAGISQDPVFGPIVMVGMGGIYAEVLKDVAVQAAPVSEEEARAMIRSLKMFAILDGARGQPKADIDAAARTVARLSEFAYRHRGDIAEIDMNPILVRPQGQGVVVLDALMIPRAAPAL